MPQRPSRVYATPLEPVAWWRWILLKRSADDPTVLAHFTLDQFMERVLIGEAPATTWC